MKKILSLVLALSMVLSLTVLPARAAGSVAVSAGTNKLLTGGSVELSAAYTGDDAENFIFWWTYESTDGKQSGKIATVQKASKSHTCTWTPATAGEFNVVCSVTDGEKNALGSSSVKVTVVDGAALSFTCGTTLSAKVGDTLNVLAACDTRLSCTEAIAALGFEKGHVLTKADGVTFRFTSSDKKVATVSSAGDVTVLAGGSAKITVSATYLGKTFSRDVTLSARSLACELSSVVNGSNRGYAAATLKTAVAAAIKGVYQNGYSASSILSFSISELPDAAAGTLYFGTIGTESRAAVDDEITDSSTLYFDAQPGYLGTASFKVNVSSKTADPNEPYMVTVTVPVVSGSRISESVSNAAADSSYSYTVSNYSGMYFYTDSAAFSSDLYNGTWSSTGKSSDSRWTYRAKGSKFVVNRSAFTSGKATLYVIGLNDKGAVSTGTVTVTQKAYDIKYDAIAGETLAFKQSDFTAFMKEAAYDQHLIDSKTSSLITFNKVRFTIPSTDEGVLYSGGAKVGSTTGCTDLSQVTLAVSARAKNTFYIDFTLYATVYASASDKVGEAVEFDNRIAVSVTHEDVRYSVSAGSTVVFRADDFLSFFRKEFPKGSLEYVTFDKLPNALDGTLYSYYGSQLSTAAKTTVDYYYKPASTRDYALSDVTYKASTWAKDGSKVYLPFTAYGSYDGGDATLCGYVAITATKTMDFADVPKTDAAGNKTWFYDSVAQAYALGLIVGYNTTPPTFGPNDTMTYAEAVTLACRMHQRYHDGAATLQNGTDVWYSTYMAYALKNGIIKTDLSPLAGMPISRKAYVDIFYAALPASEYKTINSITAIPDVANTSSNASVYTFYRAGILTGYTQNPGKAEGAFGPQDNITRCEVAAIMVRMMDASARVSFKL